MQRGRYVVIECSAGRAALQDTLDYLWRGNYTVISVVPNTGGPLSSALNSGGNKGFLIVYQEEV